jgi:hypothetical protein
MEMKQYGHSVALVLVRGMEDGVRSKPFPGMPPPELSTQVSVIQTSAFLRCSFARSLAKMDHRRRSTSCGLAVSMRTTSQDGVKSGTEVARLVVTDTLGYLEYR